MEHPGCRKLGRLFGDHAIWGNRYLPRSREEGKDSVLGELLWGSQKRWYDEHILSLQSYRRDYAEFCEAYYASLDSLRSVPAKPPYICVPYWGSNFWKAGPGRRLAVFALSSSNIDGASIPLYLPLCEIDSWEKAFKIGVKIGEKQKERPFRWQSFMSVWIAMRILFSKNPDRLQDVYYSDLNRLGDPKKNLSLLEEEIRIIKPDLVLFLGKGGYREFEGVFNKNTKKLQVCFPCGNGAGHDPNARILLECQKDLQKYLGEGSKAISTDP